MLHESFSLSALRSPSLLAFIILQLSILFFLMTNCFTTDNLIPSDIHHLSPTLFAMCLSVYSYQNIPHNRVRSHADSPLIIDLPIAIPFSYQERAYCIRRDEVKEDARFEESNTNMCLSLKPLRTPQNVKNGLKCS